ncbi:MAG: hypothetical protein M3335_00750 [Actinomycetota bacterium]|nr:hypothetical protein [Actinomycetota bacterium]
MWVGFDYRSPDAKPGWPLVWILVVFVTLFAFSGSAASIEGPLERWYSNLPFGFVQDVPVDQFVLGLSAALFLMASVNRVVRLVLDAAVTSWEKSEGKLAGGRLLGPLERLIIGAVVLTADPAAAALVVTAKGLLRFPRFAARPAGMDPMR